jgi:HD superfamily phosphohydrolase
MEINPAALTEQFSKMRDLPRDFTAGEESEYLAGLINSEPLKEKLRDYDDPRAEGAGGSGIVISAIFRPFGTRRAIKLPRKRIYEAVKTSDELPKVDPELHALSKVSHQNIIRLYEAIPLGEHQGYCIITEYVESPRSLDNFATDLCCTEECRKNDLLRADALKALAQKIYAVVDGLLYMNTVANLIHFDVKPLNILVSREGQPFITDLGFARDVAKYQAEEKVEVGFTWKYAHADLLDPHHGARVSHTAPKSKNILLGSQLKSNLDVFAFGRTLQEVLYRLKDVYGDSINSDYTFNYLHVVACLCLDGRNSADDSDDNRKSFVSDRALGMPQALFKSEKYQGFGEVKAALERLLGLTRLEDAVPELDNWAQSTINVSDLGITTLTPRMRSLWEHPAVDRLSKEMQLGMLDTVFPTATHSRLQHSLGAFHAAREYITGLYYDPENPTFRVLFSEKDCRRCLLAALIHDLGHTNFGHDLEEVDKEEFSHTAIGEEVIKSPFLRDSKRRTLTEIIERAAPDGWALNTDDLLDLLRGQIRRPMDGVFQDILDGQLDADKLDYLIRDSVECRVQYGKGIDHERLLRSLTTVAMGDGDRALLHLAIKRKGAASAEAFAFARYQLYQSLYWHHTFRAIKAMLVTAAAETFDRLRKEGAQYLWTPHPFRAAYLRHVLEVVPGLAGPNGGAQKKSSRKTNQQRIDERIEELLAAPDSPEGGRYADDKTLRFLWKLSTGKSRLLISDLIARNYYKRVIEIPLGELNERSWLDLSARFAGEKRIDLHQKIEAALKNTLITAIQDQIPTRESLVRDEVLETVTSVSAEKFIFIPDLPLRGWTASGQEPIFVSDYKRRHFRTSVGLHLQDKSGTLWSDMGVMMRRIAFFRVFCEPRIHQIVTRVLKPSAIQVALSDQLPELKSLGT